MLLAAGIALTTAAASGLAISPEVPVEAQQRQILAQIEAIGRRGFLYEVERPDGQGVEPAGRIFLYGTIHLGRVGNEPFNAPVLAALRESQRLVLEADPSDGPFTRALALELGQYPDGDGLQHHVPAALMMRVREYGSKNGLSVDRVSRFKPWLLANMIALMQVGGEGLDPSLGSEMYLTGFARSRRMPIDEVEGLETQLRMLATLPDAMQAAQLEEALAEVDGDRSRDDSVALFDLWLRGDGAAGDALVDDLHRQAADKVFERYFVETLIDRRNRVMADAAEGYLARPGNTFFAVGSLHLFGGTGLVREFERRGYRVVDLQPQAAANR